MKSRYKWHGYPYDSEPMYYGRKRFKADTSFVQRLSTAISQLLNDWDDFITAESNIGHGKELAQDLAPGESKEPSDLIRESSPRGLVVEKYNDVNGILSDLHEYFYELEKANNNMVNAQERLPKPTTNSYRGQKKYKGTIATARTFETELDEVLDYYSDLTKEMSKLIQTLAEKQMPLSDFYGELQKGNLDERHFEDYSEEDIQKLEKKYTAFRVKVNEAIYLISDLYNVFKDTANLKAVKRTRYRK